MTFTLGPTAVEAGYDLAAYDAIGSTNDEALTRARSGATGPLWVVTSHQTGGRGRRGRTWQGPRGNLAASLLIRIPQPVYVSATLGFVAGLSLSDALAACAPQATSSNGGIALELKWPNDMIAGGAKFVGILLESETASDGHTAIVVGIGVNVASAPEGMPYPATCLGDLGWTITAESVFEALSDAWVKRFAQWDEGRGMATIRDAWLSRAAGVGGPVSVALGNRDIRGVFESIDADGRLIVRTADGNRVPVAAGDVHFGAAATLPAAG